MKSNLDTGSFTNMSKGYIHSVKVPRIYKIAGNIVKGVREENGSLKNLLYEQKHPNIRGIHALSLNTLQRKDQLDYILRKTSLLLKEPRLDPWLARVLITELFWGKQHLDNNCKPILTILKYKKELQEELNNYNSIEPPIAKVVKPRYIRINTILMRVSDAIAYYRREGCSLLPGCKDYASYLTCLSTLSGNQFIQDFHIPEVFAFPAGTSFYKDSAYENGHIMLQDKASCLPSYLLNPPPGSVVLDMCAAPGMKTTHMAAMMQNQGKIYALETDKNRYEVLLTQLKTTNSYCVKPINTDALSVDWRQCPDVEYILVDPSCSGSGMIDRAKLDGKDHEYTPLRLQCLQGFQMVLLQRALTCFPTVKRVVYSTCSVHPEENEEVICKILSRMGHSYRLVSARTLMNGKWFNFSPKESKCEDKCLYAKPHVDLCNGFFIAIIERNPEVPIPRYMSRLDNNEYDADEEYDDLSVPLLKSIVEDDSKKKTKKSKKPRVKRGKKKKKKEEIQNTKFTEERTQIEGENTKPAKVKTQVKMEDDMRSTVESTEIKVKVMESPNVEMQSEEKTKFKKRKAKPEEKNLEVTEENLEFVKGQVKSKKKKANYTVQNSDSIVENTEFIETVINRKRKHE